jgi:hypothetical protein
MMVFKGARTPGFAALRRWPAASLELKGDSHVVIVLIIILVIGFGGGGGITDITDGGRAEAPGSSGWS